MHAMFLHRIVARIKAFHPYLCCIPSTENSRLMLKDASSVFAFWKKKNVLIFVYNKVYQHSHCCNITILLHIHRYVRYVENKWK